MSTEDRLDVNRETEQAELEKEVSDYLLFVYKLN